MTSRPDDDLDREIRAHLELDAEERIADGVPPEEARYAARRTFGNVTRVKEISHDMRRPVWLDRLAQDLRFAIRQIRRAPGFAAAAIVTLALGIGVNTIVFTLLNSLALRLMPVRDPAGLVRVYPVDQTGRRQNLFSYPDYVDHRDQNGLFEGLVAYIPTVVTMAAPSERSEPDELLAYAVSANYFAVLGVSPAIGRTFLARSGEPAGANPEVVISHAFWERRLGSDAHVLGRTLMLNGHPFTVVGVGPRAFFGTEPLVPDLWVPLTMQREIAPGADLLHDREAGWVLVIGRLKADVRPRTAESAMNVVARRLSAAYPGARRTAGVVFAPATFFTIDPGLRPLIALVAAIVGLVLLVACANVANLTLARATSRQREIAVRLALGASRRRLVRQLLTESVLIALLGGAAGLLLSFWTLRLLYPLGLSLLPFRWGTVILDLNPDLHVFMYTLLLAAATGVVFGLAPALQASHPNLSAAMHDEGAMLGLGWSRSRVRSGLVVVQIALSLMLLIGAGLLARGLQRAKVLDLGFHTDGVVFTDYDLQRHGYGPPAAAEFNRRLVEFAQRLPGVGAVSLTSHVPLTGGVTRTIVQVDGQEPRAGDEPVWCTYTTVSPAYFEALSLPLIKGRNFTNEETAANLPVVIVGDALARRFWPNRDPLGRRIRTPLSSTPLTVVGIVRDSSDASLWRDHEISLYFPMSPASNPLRGRLIARTASDPRAVMSALRHEARSLDPHLKFESKLLDEVLHLWILPSRVAAIGAAVLGVLALLIASVGIYGVIAYGVCHRTREIGVRMALGAGKHDVVRLVLREGMRLAGLGVAAGLAASFVTTRTLRGFLFGLSAVDPLTFAGVPIVLAAVALAACYIPARRAARVDPMTALRWE
jgi:macrolide transport system ATP-binding/permease protein